MRVPEILRAGRTTLSVEFFPPRTPEAAERLAATVDAFGELAPDFVSVTYGAGGATREATAALVGRLSREAAWETVPHLTGVGHTRGEVRTLLDEYAVAGVENVLALRGDPPRTGGGGGDFTHAADVIREIRAHPAGAGFGVGAAAFPDGHPDTPNRLLEMDHLRAKVDAGVDWLCTQLFFDNAGFFDFVERCGLAGIRVPILAGILPVTTLAGFRRMADLAGGLRIPARLLRELARWEHDAEAVRRVGVEFATAQCAELLAAGVAGLHFYPLNQPEATLSVCRRLGLKGGRT